MKHEDDTSAVPRSGKVGPVNQVNHTSWVVIVTPADRPKSVRYRSVIELFRGVVCVVILPFWHVCWCRGFCHGTESDLFLYLFKYELQFKILCMDRLSGSISANNGSSYLATCAYELKIYINHQEGGIIST